jgi:hypothetical protein
MLPWSLPGFSPISVRRCPSGHEMGKITLTLKDELEKRFREEVFRRLGMKKGNIQLAIEEAIDLWINSKKVR